VNTYVLELTKKVNFSTTRINTVSAALIHSWCISDKTTVVPVLKFWRYLTRVVYLTLRSILHKALNLF